MATGARSEQDYYPETHPQEDLGPDALETVLAIENGLKGALDGIEQLNPIVAVLNSLDDLRRVLREVRIHQVCPRLRRPRQRPITGVCSDSPIVISG